jgi:hypothetical protein
VTVSAADSNPDVPTNLTATYGQTLSDVALPTGWTWDDPTASVGNVGDNTFTATYTPSDANLNPVKATLTVTVSAADATPTEPTNLTATYGQTLSEIALPTGWAWDTPTASVGNVGDNTFTATYTPSDTNLNPVTKTLTVTVSAADATPTEPTGLTATYGQTLSEIALPTGWTWDTPTASVGSVGDNTFTATYTPSDANLNPVKKTLTVTISPATASITAKDATKVFGTAEPTLEADVTGVIPGDSLDYTLSRDDGDDVGSYTIHVIPGSNPNYSITAQHGTFTITPGSGELTVSLKGWTYGDEPNTPAVTGAKGTVTFTYSADGTNFGEAVPTDAGSYTVKAVDAGTENYTGAEAKAKFTISPRPVTVNVDDQTKVCGDEDPTLTATVTGLVEGDTLNYTLTREEGEDVGTYGITVELGDNPNYDVTAVGGTFTITEEAKSSCTVMWIIDGRIETETYEYGEMPIHAIPEKAPGLLYYYTFKGWSPAVRPVTGDITYTAIFEKNLYPFSPFYPKPADPVTPVTPKEPETPALPFTDVSESDPFYNDVLYAYENGIMNGVSETRFDPASPLTRGMIVTILYRTEGEPDVPYTGTFDDVPSGEWYTDGVEWAASKGIVKGYGDGTYGAKDLITREQLAAILYRYAEYKGYAIRTGSLSAADGGDVSGWAAKNVEWAAANGILKANGEGKIRPTEPASRAEIAAAIRAFLEGVAK